MTGAVINALFQLKASISDTVVLCKESPDRMKSYQDGKSSNHCV